MQEDQSVVPAKQSIMEVPLYITLHRYRVIFVITTLFFMWLTYDMWTWFKMASGTPTFTGEVAAGFGALALAAVAGVKFAMEQAVKKYEE